MNFCVADRGGLVFVPKLGFTANVAELDFVSQFPKHHGAVQYLARNRQLPVLPRCSSHSRTGLSHLPEKTRHHQPRCRTPDCQAQRNSRNLQKTSPPDTALRFKLQRDSMKWLLVCCFGYTGYKNARFGKIEAHEAINAVARETLLVAKEIAENDGFRTHPCFGGLALRLERRGNTRRLRAAGQRNRNKNAPPSRD